MAVRRRYDIEDALIMNRASLDRGFGRCMLMRKHGTVLKKYANRATDTIVAPDRTKVCSQHGCIVSTLASMRQLACLRSYLLSVLVGSVAAMQA